ncbi:MAG: contractile injection system tape measure protein [Pseudomonadota bacterium]
MVNRNHHLIARQTLELDVPSVARAAEIQETVARCVSGPALEEMEALFDRLCGPERVVRLDRIEIDLGNLTSADWPQQFVSQLLAKLTDTLKSVAGGPVQSSGEPHANVGTIFEQYLYFLTHGRLPWWGDVRSMHASQKLLHGMKTHEWRALASVLYTDERARHRLIHETDDDTLAVVVEQHAGLHGVLAILQRFKPQGTAPALTTSWRTQGWLAVIEPVLFADETLRGVETTRRLWRLHHEYRATSATTAVPAVESDSIRNLPAPWRDWLAKVLRHDGEFPNPTIPGWNASLGGTFIAGNNTAEMLGASDSRGLSPEANDTLPDDTKYDAMSVDQMHHAGLAPPPTFPRVPAPAQSTSNPQARIDEAIHVSGAGCVILHPFLEELFRSNELLTRRDFRDEAARARAVHLVTRLAFGDEALPEYELLMPKFLCGMAWEEPLPRVELTSDERQACDELLQAVLGHWHALKSSSANWMREQFFLRPARLEPLEQDWRLTVETRAQDVLLNRLPWGLSVIDLPWRQDRIHVRWTD